MVTRERLAERFKVQRWRFLDESDVKFGSRLQKPASLSVMDGPTYHFAKKSDQLPPSQSRPASEFGHAVRKAFLSISNKTTNMFKESCSSATSRSYDF